MIFQKTAFYKIIKLLWREEGDSHAVRRIAFRFLDEIVRVASGGWVGSPWWELFGWALLGRYRVDIVVGREERTTGSDEYSLCRMLFIYIIFILPTFISK